MNKTIHYICPAVFGESDGIYKTIFDYQEQIPTIFHDDADIYAVRGFVNNLTWYASSSWYDIDDFFESPDVFLKQEGLGYTPSMETIINSIRFFNNKGIKVQMELTNISIDKDDVLDRYGNFLLRILQDMGDLNEVVVSSKILEDYIFDAYPDIPVIKEIRDTDTLIEYSKHFKIYAGGSLNMNYAIDTEMLFQLEPSVIRTLDINVIPKETFPEYCYREEQREASSAKNLFIQDLKSEPCISSLGWKTISEDANREMHNLQELYLASGINKIRITPTGTDEKILKDNIRHIVKPEYQTETFAEMCSHHYITHIKY